MDIFGVFTMIGGLALFLFGMHIMGEGLTKLSGGRLEKILEKLTSNKYKGVLLGAGVTAIIQSSSATTVMIVGFVNSGIMKLSQAVGVIMGANIGTTITSWILSLSGIEGSNFFVKMLKPSSFSPILAAIGVVLLLFFKDDKKKDIGGILLGFAVLMFGMETMSDAVAPLKDVPEFTSILTMFSNPFLGLLAGTVLTAVIQSSSASVGILQAMCATGAVGYATAVPIIMGQNIGTCITAILSSIGTSKNAKRVSCIHLCFNLMGTILFLSVFYFINFLIPFKFLSDSANQLGIAVIHSSFNIAATVVLLPFSNYLIKLSKFFVKESEMELEQQEEKMPEIFKTLDVRFLDMPGFAIMQCKKVLEEMADITQGSLSKAINLIWNYNEGHFSQVVMEENLVDKYEDAIGTYLVKLSAKDLGEKDSRSLSLLLHSISDFERMSDHAALIAHSAKELYRKGEVFSKKAKEELVVMSSAVNEICESTISSINDENIVLAESIQPLREVIQTLQGEIKERHIKRLRKGKCTIEKGFVLADVSTSLERIAAHCSNIALSVIQICSENLDTHGYVASLDRGAGSPYEREMLKYKERYHLPE